MKFIEDPKLAEVSTWLTGKELGDKVLSCRIESFTCKMAGEDKKLSKRLEQQMVQLSASPGTSAPNFGPLTDQSVRRTLIELILTINSVFGGEYDFSAAGVDHFRKQPDAPKVVNAVNAKLADITRLYHVSFLEQLWGAIDESIKLRQCAVYSYVPDTDTGDPFTDGCLWSFNYFFFNPIRKKMLYFTCMARSKFSAPPLGESMSYSDDDHDFDDLEYSQHSSRGRDSLPDIPFSMDNN